MKRAISLILALALIAGILAPGASYASIYPGADSLKEHGFIHGNENGDLMVNKELTRAEAATLLAELYGKKTEASQYRYTGGFSDVKPGDWFAPYVGFARENNWISGLPDGRFDPTGKMTAQMWATMLMRVLGYPSTWDTVISDMEKVGIRIFAINRNAIKRGEAFDAMWTAVNKPPYGSTKPLGEIVGKLKPAPSAVKITAVQTESLKMIDLIVSGALEAASAGDVKNYRIVDANGHAQEIRSVQYDEANLRVRLLLGQPLPSQAQFSLTAAVKSKNGEALVTEGFNQFTAVDLTPPKILSLDSIGTRAFRIVFSEPVKPNPAGTLNNGDFTLNPLSTIRKITLSENGMSAVVELFNDIRGPLNVQPQPTIKDYWGLNLISAGHTIEMKADSALIQLTGVEEVTATSAVLVFNKEIAGVTSSGTYFLINGLPADDMPILNGNRVKLFFTRNFMRPGTNAIRLSTGAVRDYSGLNSPIIDYSVTVAPDTTPPQAVEGPDFTAENKLRIKFSEGLDSRTTKLMITSNYRLFKADGTDVTSLIHGVHYDSQTFTLNINLSDTIIGDYRLVIGELKDFAGNTGQTEYNFHAKDVVAPNPSKWSARVYNAGRADQVLKIRFDEPMLASGKYSVLDPENYNINGRQLDKLDSSLLRIDLVDNNSSVEISYPGATVNGGFNFSSSSDPGARELTIARVADQSGNYISPFSVSLKIASTGVMRIDRAEQTQPDTVRVEIFDTIVSVSQSDFIIEAGTRRYIVTQAILEMGADGKTLISLKADDVLKMPATVRTVRGGTVNRFGETFGDSALIPIEDKIGPAIEQVMLDSMLKDYITYSRSSGVITIRFTEEIDARTVSLLTFEMPGFQIEDISARTNELMIRIAAADRGRVQEQDAIIQKVELRDRSGNGTAGLNLRVQKVYP